jgi:fumarylpyruvate hydrolase
MARDKRWETAENMLCSRTRRTIWEPIMSESSAHGTGQAAGFVIQPNPVPVLPVEGTSDVFPVNRIFCIGRNYAAHAVEMWHDPDKEPPFFFLKHPAAVITDGTFPYPSETSDVHHEIEMVVALDKGGKNIPVDAALEHVYGYGVGLDMTRRDLQAEAKKLGRPWEVAKSFEASAPSGPLVPASRIGHPARGRVELTVNGEVRQEGDLNQMIWKVPEMIAVLSRYFELQPGDIIMTGTPAGVGAVQRGDVMEASIEGVGRITVKVI